MSPDAQPLLVVDGISRAFGRERVLESVSLSVRDGETLAVLGRSGCGKTTLLKIFAGLIKADAGRVQLAGVDITDNPANDRGMIYLYQEALLFPHLNVFDNIAFGLRLQKRDETEVRDLTNAKIAALDLSEHADKMPDQLSGGQRQRVAFGRALIIRPKLLLLDEPFGALDTTTRAHMQDLFKSVAEEEGIASIFVTHDLKEALLMGDSFAYMEGGGLKTFASRQDFIDAPETGVGSERAFWTGLR